MTLSSVVPRRFAGTTLLDYLAARFTYLDIDEWKCRVAERRVRINEAIAGPDAALRPDDVVRYDVPDMAEPPADTSFTILYEDEWLMGVNKPGNLLVHKSGKSLTMNLIYQVRYNYLPPRYRAVDVVNRLDRETSGVVLLAKGPEALREMHRRWTESRVAKTYTAIVHAVPASSPLTVDKPVGKDLRSVISYKHCIDEKNGKKAVTGIETVETIGGRYAVLKVEPITGRTHQIRVHCAHIGTPIVGDKLYGMSEKEYMAWRGDPEGYTDRLEFPRQALHCGRVQFEHPFTGRGCAIEAPLPEDMRGLIEKLKREE